MNKCSNCKSICSSKKSLTTHEEACVKARPGFTWVLDMKVAPCRQKIIQMMTEVMTDTLTVFDFGAKKHPDSGNTPNFLEVDGNKCSLRERGSSVLRHGARTFMDPGRLDDESNLPELLQLIASASILYIRHKRNITHPLDELAER
jgi:hypothetical protein